MMNPPPKKRRGKQRSDRDRDHRQHTLHSQKRGRSVCEVAAPVPDQLAACAPIPTVDAESPRPNQPELVEEVPNLQQRDLSDIIQHALSTTVGSKYIFAYLSSICVSIDQQLGDRSLNLSVEIRNLPKYRKKATKKRMLFFSLPCIP